MSLSVQQIKKSRKREWLPVPEWTPEGETHDPAKHGVYVARFGTRSMLAYEEEVAGKTDANGDCKPEHRAELLALLAVFGCQDADGAALFDKSDLAWLVNEDVEVLNKIAATTMRLNGLGESASVERLGNSPASPGSSSSSDSLAT